MGYTKSSPDSNFKIAVTNENHSDHPKCTYKGEVETRPSKKTGQPMLYRHGLGVMIYANLSRYEGQWCDGERHGFGILFSKTGDIIHAGRWERDEFVGDS